MGTSRRLDALQKREKHKMGVPALSEEVSPPLLQSIQVRGCAARSAGGAVVPSHTPTQPDPLAPASPSSSSFSMASVLTCPS